ncbi:MAG: hypothetical protein LUC41_05640 [Clostridiales bacterium]|nr:hypothetical protein [Clostridiales bacterium]
MESTLEFMPLANRELNLDEVAKHLDVVRDVLEQVVDQYDEDGSERTDELAEALDALENASEIINGILMDEL